MKQTFTLAFALFFFSVTAFAQDAEQWSRFRGPNGQGISTATGLPTQWSATENIAWKTPIPGGSWSSPVIWNDHIFLTTTTDGGKECRVLAIDRKSGDILWNKMVFTQEIQQKHGRNSEATPTPVTDGERVYVLFANGRFAALNFAGEVIWTNNHTYYSHHGLGTSPILYDDLLITAINPSVDPRNNPNNEDVRGGWQVAWDRSYLLALDKNTGEEKWRTPRGMSRISHSVPVIIQVDGKVQILSMAGDVIQGFAPTGELIWTVRSSGEPAVPTPAVGEGVIFASTIGPITAVRTNGTGDVTSTHVLWQQSQNVPMISSFLYVKPLLFSAHHQTGVFAAHDEATGEIVWRHSLEGAPDSSPIYADGKIYITTHIGVTTVLKLNEDPRQRPEVVAVNDIGETVQATLAIAGTQIFLRTDKELWCIGK